MLDTAASSHQIPDTMKARKPDQGAGSSRTCYGGAADQGFVTSERSQALALVLAAMDAAQITGSTSRSTAAGPRE